MAFNFPNSPSDGDIYGNFTYSASVPGWRKTPENAASLPAGTIVQWAATTPPANWLICDGSAISRSTYSSLFAAIGVQFGVGDGSTTFNLPDLRGRVAVGKNSGTFATLGATGGAETHTLTISEIPSHTHVQDAHNHTQNSHNHTQNEHNHISGSNTVTAMQYVGSGGNSNWNFGGGSNAQQRDLWPVTATNNATTATNNATTATNQNTGGGGAHNNLQPYIVLNYIIKTSAGITSGDSELATRVGAAELDISSLQAIDTSYESRLDALELANASSNLSGLVPVIPTSISVASGTATLNTSTGRITCTSATNILLNGVFTSTYRNYLILINASSSGPNKHQIRFSVGGSIDSSSNYTYTDFYSQAGGTGGSGAGTGQTIATMLYGEYVQYWVYNPAISDFPTKVSADGIYSHTKFIAEGGYNANKSFDGIWIANNAITGQVMVYGFRD